jgi:hypothetical protein
MANGAAVLPHELPSGWEAKPTATSGRATGIKRVKRVCHDFRSQTRPAVFHGNGDLGRSASNTTPNADPAASASRFNRVSGHSKNRVSDLAGISVQFDLWGDVSQIEPHTPFPGKWCQLLVHSLKKSRE